MRSVFLYLNIGVVVVGTTSCGLDENKSQVQETLFDGLTVGFSPFAQIRADFEAKGLVCIDTPEPADPHSWSDNSLCFSRELEGKVKWSFAGKIAGMNCRQIHEQSEPQEHTWLDNYLCFTPDVPYEFRWYSAAPNQFTEQGLACTPWNELADPNSWSDNFLCWRKIQPNAQTCEDGNCDQSGNEDEQFPIRADEACGEPTFNLGVSEVCGPAVENGVELWRQGKCGEQPREGRNQACPGFVPAGPIERHSTIATCPSGTQLLRTEILESGACKGDPGLDRPAPPCRTTSIIVCQTPAVINTCRTPENGFEDIICRSPQFGIERAAQCRNKSFGVERFKTCRLRKNRSELERFFIGFDSSFENFAILLAENYSGYIATIRGRNEMGCFLTEVQNDVLLADVFDKNRTLFSALFGGEAWNPDNFTNCTVQASAETNILNETCDGQSDLRKCGFVNGYRSAFNWMADQLSEAKLLRTDRIARVSTGDAIRIEAIGNKAADTLNKHLLNALDFRNLNNEAQQKTKDIDFTCSHNVAHVVWFSTAGNCRFRNRSL